MKSFRYSLYLLIPLAFLPLGYLVYYSHDFFYFSPFSLKLIFSACFLITVLSLTYAINMYQLIKREKKQQQKMAKHFSVKEQEYISLIENAGGVLYRCDPLGNFNYLSKKCLELTGYTDHELRGKHFTWLILEEWKMSVLDFYQEQNQKRIPETVHRFPIITKDGYKKWVEQTVVLVHDGIHRTGYQGIVKDVTDRKLGEDLLREANKKLIVEKQEADLKLQAVLDYLRKKIPAETSPERADIIKVMERFLPALHS